MQPYLYSVKCSSSVVETSGSPRFVHRWVPNSVAPWAALTVVHGFGNHGGRFAGMGASLASFGIAVQAIDLIGHGRSPGRRGCIDSYEQLLDDVCVGLHNSISGFPSTPQFLFGQSMGGNLILNLALRRPDAVAGTNGLIVSSPMLRSSEMPKERIMDAGRWLATKLPNWRIKASVEVTKLSHDRRAQDAYMRDRLVHRTMSLRLATTLVDSGVWALENAASLQCRTLLMHGTDDTLTCPKVTRSFADSASEFATLKLWHGCRHDLHDDLQRERVFDYMSRWMKQQCVTTFKFQRSPLAASA